MTDEMKEKMMQSLLQNARVGQMNVVVESGATVNYYEAESRPKGAQTRTDEEVSRAITSINGVDKVLKHQHAFLGICCYLASCEKWPSKINMVVERIAQLPDAGKWEIPCKWESVRKFVRYKFALKDYREWDEFNPSDAEREIFKECRDVARAFEQQLLAEKQP
jgi:hypothetical protein